MANTPATQQQAAPAAAPKPMTVSSLMSSPNIKQKFNEVWSNPAMANSFVSTVISVTNGNAQLRQAEPMSIVSAAMVAATLQLQINPALGFAYIVPYGKQAQFQIGYKGLLQLCQRSGQFQKIITLPVCEGELVDEDPFMEEYTFDRKAKKSDKVIGYMARYVLLNGFIKTVYWTKEEVEKHARKFSKAFANGWTSPWKSDFDAMALKTVLKQALKFAPMNVEMTLMQTYDQAVVNPNTNIQDADYAEINIDAFTPEYVDNDHNERAQSTITEIAAEAAKKEAKK